MTTTAPTAAAVAGHSPTTAPSAAPGLTAGYAYEWARFVDWCTATDTTALPASPVSVAEFIGDHPAPPGTQRRRLAAVTAAHTAAGHPSPARAAAIRALLHPQPATADQADGAAGPQAGGDLLTGLASTGWPHGLFGRRDALLLLTTQAGLGPAAAVRLHRSDLTTTADGHLEVRTGPFDRVVLPPAADTRSCPGCVHRRWTDVLDAVHTDPTRRTLRATLHTATAPTATSPHPCAQPRPERPAGATTDGELDGLLLTRIDGWGWLPWADQGALTAKAAARIVHAHRTGAPPTHRHLPAPAPDPADQDEEVATTPPPPVVPQSTAADRADRAAAAARRRRADLDALTAATDALTGLDARLQDLLQRTLDLLDDPAMTPKPRLTAT